MFTELLGRLRALVSIDRRRSEKFDQFANRSEKIGGIIVEIATANAELDRAATKTAVAIKGLQKIRKTLEAEHADILGYNDWTELTNTDWDAK